MTDPSHVLDGVGICVMCGACKCCITSDGRTLAEPCPGTLASKTMETFARVKGEQ